MQDQKWEKHCGLLLSHSHQQCTSYRVYFISAIKKGDGWGGGQVKKTSVCSLMVVVLLPDMNILLPTSVTLAQRQMFTLMRSVT